MTNLNIKSKSRGFTIVELLVVIVVIGILAAISVVSYTGVTQRANGSSAKSTANNVISKVDIYVADSPSNSYPLTLASAIAAGTSSAALSGITIGNGAAALNATNITPNKVSYQICSTATTLALTTATNATGVKVGYWDYDTTPAQAILSTGTVSGTVLVSGTPTAVNCFYTAS
jgi:prepilin-type N-terminal cleavage/methylation domain-containing protein